MQAVWLAAFQYPEFYMENMEETNFGPQYPAEFYTRRPNDTALLSPLYDFTFKGIFTQETEESYLALQSFLSAVLGKKIINVKLKPNEPAKETSEQKGMSFDVSAEFDEGRNGKRLKYIKFPF